MTILEISGITQTVQHLLSLTREREQVGSSDSGFLTRTCSELWFGVFFPGCLTSKLVLQPSQHFCELPNIILISSFTA